jgi:hypothetical protein
MSRTVKKITIFVHNPREVEKRTEFEETVSSLLEVHPEARLLLTRALQRLLARGRWPT